MFLKYWNSQNGKIIKKRLDKHLIAFFKLNILLEIEGKESGSTEIADILDDFI